MDGIGHLSDVDPHLVVDHCHGVRRHGSAAWQRRRAHDGKHSNDGSSSKQRQPATPPSGNECGRVVSAGDAIGIGLALGSLVLVVLHRRTPSISLGEAY
jgi:hypothetical protein